ncbi:MAG: hypothetical protein RJB38_2324 [Pseudomonadota bacterium]|jgi:signal transduction histidine kinase
MDVHEDVVALLQGKSRCLAQMIALSRSFISSAEPHPVVGVDAAVEFEKKRSDAFKTLELIDARLSQLLSSKSQPAADRPDRALLEVLKQQIHELLSLDARIIPMIEEAKSQISREIHDTQRLKDRLSKFKSQWVPEQGEGLDQTL